MDRMSPTCEPPSSLLDEGSWRTAWREPCWPRCYAFSSLCVRVRLQFPLWPGQTYPALPMALAQTLNSTTHTGLLQCDVPPATSHGPTTFPCYMLRTRETIVFAAFRCRVATSAQSAQLQAAVRRALVTALEKLHTLMCPGAWQRTEILFTSSISSTIVCARFALSTAWCATMPIPDCLICVSTSGAHSNTQGHHTRGFWGNCPCRWNWNIRQLQRAVRRSIES